MQICTSQFFYPLHFKYFVIQYIYFVNLSLFFSIKDISFSSRTCYSNIIKAVQFLQSPYTFAFTA